MNKSKEVKPLDATAKDVVNEFTRHWRYAQSGYHIRWHEAWSITNNMRINRGYEGVSDTFIPLTFSIVESIKANVIGGRPKITFLPTTDEQQGDTNILDGCMDYVWDKGYYQLRVTDWVDGALTYGTAILQVVWDEKLDVPVPRFIPIKDFWIDPTASSIEMAEREGLPCGYRYLTTTDALKARRMVNPDFDETKPESDSNQRIMNIYDLKAIDKAGEFTANQTDAMDKNMWQGTTLNHDDAKTKQVEVIVRYGDGKKIEVINRIATIYSGEAEIDEMYPFSPLYDYKDASLFYGRGVPDIIKQRQEELNDVENQDTDNMSYILDNVKWIDPAFAHLAPQIVSGPGVVVPINAQNWGEMPKPPVNEKAHEKREEIKEDMKEAVAAGEIAQSAEPQGSRTATEVNASQLNAGKRFDTMIQQMENGGFQRLAKLIFKFMQKYADKDMMFRTVGNKGVRFQKFLKSDYPGEWDPRVQLAASAKTEQANAATLQGQMYEQYSQSPLVNQLELLKLDMSKQYGLDDPEVELLLSNPNQSGDAQASDDSEASTDAMGAVGAAMPAGPAGAAPGALGAPAAPAGPTMPGQAAPPGPQPGGVTGDVNESADLVKLYVAAVSAGDTSLMDQIIEKLGFTPSDELPAAIQAQHAQRADQHVKAGLAVQKQQHDQEQAQAGNTKELINQAMAVQSHQQQMEQPIENGPTQKNPSRSKRPGGTPAGK